MLIEFFKYQGAGNDFIILDNKKGNYNKLPQHIIERLCHRNFGIGADGLMLFNPSEKYDFKMHYFNSDGKEGTMCGNGGRCIVQFAADQKIAVSGVCFEAVDGLHEAEKLKENWISLHMNDVDQVYQDDQNYLIDTGSPHYVIFRDEIEQMDLIKEAHVLRYSKRFKTSGININYVKIQDKELFIRTYERGVENETLACGTGSVAAAIAYLVKHPTPEMHSHNILIHAIGGDLEIEVQTKDYKSFTNIKLNGPARFVFKGEIEI